MQLLAALPLLAAFLASVTPASAQTTGGSNVTCTYAFWEFNTVGESPCFVWGQLQSLCITGGLTVTPLINASYQYSPPSLSGQVNDCNCNVVSYNLMAACSWCQPNIYQSNWVTEAQWKSGCTSYNSTGISDESSASLSAIGIPQWAYAPDNGASWDPDTAEAIFNSTSSSSSSSVPSSTASASATAAGTSSSASAAPVGGGSSSGAPPATSTVAGSGSGSGSTSSKSSSNTGAIAGGVVGGVAALVLIAGLIFWLVRRNRNTAAVGAAGTGAAAGAGAAGPGQGQWQQYGEQKPAMAQYGPPAAPYTPVPTTPYPPGTTPSPYPYQPSTTSASATAYDPHGNGTSYAGSPPPPGAGGYYQQPGYGEPYGAQGATGRYTGLPEA